MAIRNWKDIPLFKDVTDEQWNDWHWQVEHRLTTVEEIAQVVNLSDQEKADIEKVMGGFRVGITPYYASLMDPDDPRDPVRMQAVPTLAEMHRSAADDLDPLHEDADSPAPGLTHRYPDRVLFLITQINHLSDLLNCGESVLYLPVPVVPLFIGNILEQRNVFPISNSHFFLL